ncbi:putative bifunctional diguanylate cyclase/phosphodiesterase [Pontixanthobacter aquaemixtae]|uniref:putative bifunctional diguanylate cyclase/phosphodiesterase n=1 Tax=Pontixanthobacter aquaemixtae TaxID=1958940 RepID=UPI001371F26A|nr:EAL domain-containing protein [Pontixanthobacter aquaemixtae]
MSRSDSTVVTLAYQPIIIGYFVIVAAYYMVMTPLHLSVRSGSSLLLLASLSLLTAIASIAAWKLASKKLSIVQFELLVGSINLLIISNILAALYVDYDQSKLVYFIIIVMVFALASASTRQALFSILVALACLSVQVAVSDPSATKIYAFVGFAASIGSVAIAYYLRRAIWLALDASNEAEAAREYAEDRLAKAVEINETMRLQSMTDDLTGLPNRRGFFAKLVEGKLLASQSEPVQLMLLDLDGFKAVNDSYGHNMGDELLRCVSRRLEEHCLDDGYVSRIGGDEFSILHFGGDDSKSLKDWCEALLSLIAETYLIEDRLIQISGSIGCCEVVADETDNELLQKADFALIHAKKSGKNRHVIFDGEHAERAERHFRIERALRTADFDKEIDIVFQPQFDLVRQTYVGAEALARWSNPLVGEIGPGQFIKIAEETGLIANITTTVLKKTIEARRKVDVGFPVSVNLSAYDLNSNQTTNEILDCLDQGNVAPEHIEFEITETAMMADADRATANLNRLVDRGHSIALDDFGTGYSNFNYLRTLPIHKLKVDRSFLENQADPMTERVLRSLVGMVRTLDVPCLIEGVEDQLDLVLAQRAGINLVQGFLFGRPMSIEALQAEIVRMESFESRAKSA